MIFNSALFDPIHVWLEIDSALQAQSWQQSQPFATDNSRWVAYLNQLSLSTLLPWLQEDEPQTRPSLSAAAFPSIWELTNGTALTLGHHRLVLIPTDAVDIDEIRVPQEWVDIPDWAADYYLAVQVNMDDAWVRVSGFVTHQQLKEQGRYDWRDRTYSLGAEAWVEDLNVLWVSRQLMPEASLRAALQPLPDLPLAQAEQLLQRLGNPALPTPRLEIPFEQWGALLSHGGWRQRLLELRRGLPEQRSVLQWLQTGVSGLVEQLGWGPVEFQPGLASARGEMAESTVAFSRVLAIAGQSYELTIAPIDATGQGWRFELRNLAPGGLIPGGFKLRLLTEDLQPFEGNEDTATTAVEELYIEVAIEPGEGLVWETEPLPDLYDREILRF